jgi:chromosome segregation ATPase
VTEAVYVARFHAFLPACSARGAAAATPESLRLRAEKGLSAVNRQPEMPGTMSGNFTQSALLPTAKAPNFKKNIREIETASREMIYISREIKNASRETETITREMKNASREIKIISREIKNASREMKIITREIKNASREMRAISREAVSISRMFFLKSHTKTTFSKTITI